MSAPAKIIDDPIVCRCRQVRTSTVVDYVQRRRPTALRQIVRDTGAGTRCAECRYQLHCYLKRKAACPANGCGIVRES